MLRNLVAAMLISLLGTITPTVAQATARLASDQNIKLRIVQRVDLTSFPNSTGPRRMPGKRTLADYGFTDLTFTDAGVEARKADGKWEITFDHIIHAGEYWINLCFRDKALNGGSYNSAVPLVLELRTDGMYSARVEQGFGLPTCPSPVLPAVR